MIGTDVAISSAKREEVSTQGRKWRQIDARTGLFCFPGPFFPTFRPVSQGGGTESASSIPGASAENGDPMCSRDPRAEGI